MRWVCVWHAGKFGSKKSPKELTDRTPKEFQMPVKTRKRVWLRKGEAGAVVAGLATLLLRAGTLREITDRLCGVVGVRELLSSRHVRAALHVAVGV